MKRAFILLIVVVSILASAFGSFFFIALLPFADVAGKLLIGLLAIAIGCIGTMGIAYAYYYIRMLGERRKREALHSHLIIADGVVSFAHDDGSFTHLSSIHEEAKRPLMLPAPVSVSEVDEETDEEKVARIKKLYDAGLVHIRDIVKATGYSQYFVQKTTAPWRGLAIDDPIESTAKRTKK